MKIFIFCFPLSSTGNFFSQVESKMFQSEPSQKIVTTEKCFPTSRNQSGHGIRMPREEVAFTARQNIRSQSQIFRYGRSIFCLPNRPDFSDTFDLCLHWVSVVRDKKSPRQDFFKRTFISASAMQ